MGFCVVGYKCEGVPTKTEGVDGGTIHECADICPSSLCDIDVIQPGCFFSRALSVGLFVVGLGRPALCTSLSAMKHRHGTY